MLVGQDAHNAISCADSLHAVSLFNFAGIAFAIDVEIVDTTTKATRRSTEYAESESLVSTVVTTTYI